MKKVDTSGNPIFSQIHTKLLRPIVAVILLSTLLSCGDDDSPTDSPDLTPPVIVTYNPLQDQTMVPVVTDIWISFTRPLDSSTVTDSSLKINGSPVGSIECIYDTLFISCDHPLDYGASYTVTVDNSVKFSDGGSLDETYEWSFETREMPGLEWESYELEIDGYPGLTGAAYASETYILIDQNGRIVRSGNGVNWEPPKQPVSKARLLSISFIEGLFFITGSHSTIVTSSDGIAWDVVINDDEASRSFYDVLYADSKFIAVGGHKLQDNNTYLVDVRTSTDGSAWTAIVQDVEGRFTDIEYYDGKYVALGEYIHPDSGKTAIWTSTNLSDWELKYKGTNSSGFIDLESSHDMLLAIGIGLPGYITCSSNGTDWNELHVDDSFAAFDLTWTGTHFMAAGHEGRIFCSADGSEWSSMSIPEAEDMIIFGIWGSPDLLVAVGGRQVFISR